MNPEIPRSIVEPSALISLLGSMGSSGAAIFVMHFLTTQFTKSNIEERANFARLISEMNQRTYEMARENAEVMRENAVSMSKMADAIDGLKDVVERLAQPRRWNPPAVKP